MENLSGNIYLIMIGNFLSIVFFFVIIWIFGRMGDNINKIRKLLEEEFERKNNSQPKPERD